MPEKQNLHPSSLPGSQYVTIRWFLYLQGSPGEVGDSGLSGEQVATSLS